MRSKPSQENVSFLASSKQQFPNKSLPWTLPLSVSARLSDSSRALCLLSYHLPFVSGPLRLPLTCPLQIFSFEINVSVAIITFASRPRIVMSVLHHNSRDVMEVINSLDNIHYKGMGVIK